MWFQLMDNELAGRIQRARHVAPARPGLPCDCPRCDSRLFEAEVADSDGHRVVVLHCISCGTYVEPGHVPDTEVVRTVRGPRGPRK